MGNGLLLLGALEFVEDERKVVAVNKSVLNEYNGIYKSETGGNVYTVTNDGKNMIWITSEGEKYTLIPQSEYSFYIEGQPQNIIFGRVQKGKVSFYTFINGNTCSISNKYH